MAERHFCQASLEYVFLLQEVQERKKFEFVETVSSPTLHVKFHLASNVIKIIFSFSVIKFYVGLAYILSSRT